MDRRGKFVWVHRGRRRRGVKGHTTLAQDNRIFLAGRVALVTGASRGIGRAIAMAFAEAGASLAIHYRDNANLAEELTKEIEAIGRHARAYQADLFRAQDRISLVAKVAQDFGGLDILVCNAGDGGPGRPISETTIDDLDRVMQINASAPFHLCQLALPHLRLHSRSDVLLISSIITRTYLPDAGAYAMSKAALNALGMTLAKEERASGVRVNIVSPSLTETDLGRAVLARRHPTSHFRDLDAMSPFGRIAQPADVAAAAVYLVSAANPYASGQNLCIDGGG